jgi:hypothetical protein
MPENGEHLHHKRAQECGNVLQIREMLSERSQRAAVHAKITPPILAG